MQTVILAGGLGTRLRPITEQIPKPMVEVNGRPFLEYILRHMAGQGFDRILLLVGYLGSQIEAYFGDGSRFGVSIDYSFEDRPLGTGGALRQALAKLDNRFLLLYGDSFLPIDYRQVSNAFSQSAFDGDGLLVVYQNHDNDTGVPSNVALNRGRHVIRYEKGARGSGLGFVDAGALCLRSRVLQEFSLGEAMSLEHVVFPMLIARHQLDGFITEQRFFDIGTPERLREFGETQQLGSFGSRR